MTITSKSGTIEFEVIEEDGLFTVYQLQDGYDPAEHQTFTDQDKAIELAETLAQYT